MDTAFAVRLASYLKIDPSRVTAEPHGINVILAVDGAAPDGEIADAIRAIWDRAIDPDEWVGRAYASPITGGMVSAPVANEEEYWGDDEPPPVPSPRFLEWSERMRGGWRPSPRVRSLGYHEEALWYGVWIYEVFRLRDLIHDRAAA